MLVACPLYAHIFKNTITMLQHTINNVQEFLKEDLQNSLGIQGAFSVSIPLPGFIDRKQLEAIGSRAIALGFNPLKGFIVRKHNLGKAVLYLER